MKSALIIGMGYVGLSNAIALSSEISITVFDKDKNKIDLIKKNISPIIDCSIDDYLIKNKFNFSISLDSNVIHDKFDYIFLCLPTDFDDTKGTFDTSIIENYLKDLSLNNSKAEIVIKSTVNVGFTDKMIKKYKNLNILFSPEFLREGNGLKDILNPKRIVVGGNKKLSVSLSKIFRTISLNKEVVEINTDTKEAEAIKLFSNTFLANRVAFFNELDSFSITNNLDSKKIIEGVCLDERIGNFYNNPSFGYGGYCLPKDSLQLLSDFKDTPQQLIKAITNANEIRKLFITDEILKLKPKSIGVYKLSMKKDSANYRSSAIIDIIELINEKNESIEIYIYDQNVNKSSFRSCKVINDLSKFKDLSDVILANRLDDDINDVKSKLYTRDIFGRN